MFIQGLFFPGLLILLHSHVQCSRRSLLGQGQKFRHINVDADVVRIAVPLGPVGIVGYELQVYLAQMEGVVSDLHEAAFRVLANDLSPAIP